MKLPSQTKVHRIATSHRNNMSHFCARMQRRQASPGLYLPQMLIRHQQILADINTSWLECATPADLNPHDRHQEQCSCVTDQSETPQPWRAGMGTTTYVDSPFMTSRLGVLGARVQDHRHQSHGGAAMHTDGRVPAAPSRAEL
jgi:hypothetical protein